MNDFNKKPEEAVAKSPKPEDSDDDDITVQLNSAIDKTKEETKEKAVAFQALDLGTPGSTFIRADIPDHYDLGLKIINELAETKVKRTRYTNRIIPIEKVCKAKLDDICDAAGELFDKHFLKQPSTFAIIFNRKYNSEMNRDEIIKQLAELVHLKNMGNKVNLKTPEKTIICEVLKGMCMLTVVPDYFKLKKFNLHELGKKDVDDKTQEKSVKKEEEDDTKSTQEVPSANGDEKTEDDDKIKEEAKE